MRSDCPIARALDVFGDRWTLLVLRDLMFFGKRTFGDFQASAEGIAPNILADRLKALEANGLIARRPSESGHPRRFTYHLTSLGWSLEPTIRTIARWGVRHGKYMLYPDPTKP